MLYVVATPIGNLGDVTLRAIEVLKSVDLIACEDTRHSRILLDHYGIKTPTTSFFQHNRFTKGESLLRILKEGKDIALVSDAGTPGILDPGYNLVNLAITNSIPMTLIPGPTALINALVLSGKPAHKFVFEGFLPNKPIARRNRLQELSKMDYTIVFYESCHRILDTLSAIRDIWPGKEVVICRELTKKFEEVLRAKPETIISHLKSHSFKGEFVVVV
ncbi:MAG: 16S rRNA (cytidine(1402)-2'-O)-methyltransferase [Candidatus Omnitrophica bacterium]|jgi:16S rRNA (cytidine1402-2'-O)-methyltransferase|nr:16S rRNA (cytidine(1402)-2'-O)-methyltransferase [Candidatus Omnitrophota bacterium]MDD5080017.1 16S rRNA (cytidine(1402)-2'-O)-methyltransferase [Candidatus Omnitrophota bacterium]